MALIDGDNAVLDDPLPYTIYNEIKNHWRGAAAPGNIQPGMIWSETVTDKLYHHGAADEEILQLIRSNDVSPQFATVRLMDTGADHYLDLKCNENLTGHKLLNLVVGDAARTITLSGNPTLSDWFDQAVKQASSPTFAGLTVSGAGFFNLGSDSATINTGAITATHSWMKLTTEGAAHDDLATINGGAEGDWLIITNECAFNITLKNGTGNLFLDSDYTIIANYPQINMLLMKIGAEWVEVSCFDRA